MTKFVPLVMDPYIPTLIADMNTSRREMKYQMESQDQSLTSASPVTSQMKGISSRHITHTLSDMGMGWLVMWRSTGSSGLFSRIINI